MELVPVKSGTELAGSVERLFLEAFPEVERLPLEPLFRFADTDIADFYFTMIMECHLLQCTGSTDSIIWLGDTMISIGCRCQTLHLMYADTPIARIWQNRE